MNNKFFPTRLIALITLLFLSFFTFSCGTILYPERKGQVSGRIDPGVAVLNGIGLLFFLIPGVIAFAVDFSNGTIYLPSGSSAENGRIDIKDMQKIKTQNELNPQEIEKIIKKHTGKDIDFELAEITAVKQ